MIPKIIDKPNVTSSIQFNISLIILVLTHRNIIKFKKFISISIDIVSARLYHKYSMFEKVKKPLNYFGSSNHIFYMFMSGVNVLKYLANLCSFIIYISSTYCKIFSKFLINILSFDNPLCKMLLMM